LANIGGSNKLLTLREVAELLGYAENTLYNQWRTWGLPFYRVGAGGRGGLRVKERDVWNWLETRVAA
jgi:excisionase family DNA binding protein